MLIKEIRQKQMTTNWQLILVT